MDEARSNRLANNDSADWIAVSMACVDSEDMTNCMTG